MSIRKVAWFGTGKNGRRILEAVATSGLFEVTLLTRRPLDEASIPAQVAVAQVDFSDKATLVNALRGQDAVVVFTKFTPGSTPDKIQIPLIDASIEVGVKLFVPSEWAPDTAGGNASTSTRIGESTMPPTGVLGPKRATHNYLFGRAAEGLISYCLVYPGIIIESAFKGGMFSFDFEKKVAQLPDGGIHPFSTTSMHTLEKVVIGLLAEYPKSRNRLLYIADGITTQLALFRTVEKVTKQKWSKISVPIVEEVNKANQKISSGTFGGQEFKAVLTAPFFSGMTVWRRLDHALVGVEDDDLIDPADEMTRVVSEIVGSRAEPSSRRPVL